VIGVPTGVFRSIGNLRRRVALVGFTALALAMVPATASAADPSTHQYVSTLDQVSQGNGGASVADPGGVGGVGGDSSSLPFTGLDLGLLAVAAAALVVAGLLLRRGRSEPTEV
jgi:hypothetical protein